MRPTTDERFWQKVEKRPDGCWIWTASGDPRGYGGFWNGKKLVRAHRWSYERFVGAIPEGLHLDHLCRVPPCVNPAHLEPVTPKQNSERGFSQNAINARKTHCHRGHPLSGDNLLPKKGCGRCCRECNRQSAENCRKRMLDGTTPMSEAFANRSERRMRLHRLAKLKRIASTAPQHGTTEEKGE